MLLFLFCSSFEFLASVISRVDGSGKGATPRTMAPKCSLNPTKNIFSRHDTKLRRRRPKQTLNHRLLNQPMLKYPPIYETRRLSPRTLLIKMHLLSSSRASTSHHGYQPPPFFEMGHGASKPSSTRYVTLLFKSNECTFFYDKHLCMAPLFITFTLFLQTSL